MRTVVVAHKYLPQPDDDLVAHLATRGHEVLHVFHSFPDAADRCSYWRLYREGALAAEGRSRDWRAWPEAVVYLKELACTVSWVARNGKWDRYIGMDGLCVAFGSLLRMLGRVRRTVFWCIDFVPDNRFASRLKNHIYARVNRHACVAADEVWDLGPRMAQARERYASIPPSAYRQHRIVPYGLWLERIRPVAYEECDRHTVVFMGHLLEKQGVQLVLRAMPQVLARVPQARLKVIGGGSHAQALQALALELGVSGHCDFLGKVPTLEEVEREVARSAVALAPYVSELDNWTRYADPGKVKTYLACGVPLLLTDVPWNAREIEQAGAGRIITEDPAEIASAIVAALEPDTNRRMRAAAHGYARSFDWARIFETALAPAPPQAQTGSS